MFHWNWQGPYWILKKLSDVEYRETPTPEDLPADQPDIHNQEQHEENQDDVQVDAQHQH